MSVNGGPDIIESGLVFYLDAANPRSYPRTGTTCFDFTANGNNGTLTNGPTFDSRNNGSINFDGVDDRIECGNASSLQITVGTISVWFNATSGNSGYRGILTKRTAWGLFVKDNILIAYDWGNSPSDRSTGITVGNGTWNHVTMTFTETVGTPSNNAIVYLNGVSVLTATVKHSAQSTIMVLGNGGDSGTSQHFIGRIAQSCVYNRVLSAQEVQQNFRATRRRFGV